MKPQIDRSLTRTPRENLLTSFGQFNQHAEKLPRQR